MKQTDYDIIIVGASFAWLTFAHHISSKYKILIIDKKEQLNSQMESTWLITQWTKDLLDEFIPEVNNYITNKINSIGIVNSQYSQNFFSHTPKPWIYTTDTPNLLKHIANQLPSNIEIRTNTTFINVKDNSVIPAKAGNQSKKIPFKKNTKRSLFVTIKQWSETKILNTKFLIWADGSRSEVAKKTWLDQNTKHLIWLEKALEWEILLWNHPKSCIYHCWFWEFSLGYSWWLSPSILNGKEIIRIGLAKLENWAKDLHKIDEFIKVLEKQNIIKLKNRNALEMYAWSIPIWWPLSKVSNSYCLLLWDAAWLCGAFAADGIKWAIVSGKVGARIVDKYLQWNKKALKNYKKDIQKESWLIKYFYKQLFYRFCRDSMKSNKTFDSLFEIVKKNSGTFLHQFCDSKDKGSSLLNIILSIKNIKLLFKFIRFVILDFFKKT